MDYIDGIDISLFVFVLHDTFNRLKYITTRFSNNNGPKATAKEKVINKDGNMSVFVRI